MSARLRSRTSMQPRRQSWPTAGRSPCPSAKSPPWDGASSSATPKATLSAPSNRLLGSRDNTRGLMKKANGLLMLAIGLLVVSPAGGEDAMSDLNKLRGTWLTVSLVTDGKTLVDEKTAPKEGPATKLVYDGNKWMIKVGDKTVAGGVFKIDGTKTPK